MKKSTLFFFLLIVTLLSLNTYIVANKKTPSVSANRLLSCEQLLQHANRLSSKKLYRPAAEIFSDYIDSCSLGSEEAAISYLRVADLYYDSKQYDKALSAYYLAETLDQGLKKFTSEKIVNTLENLDLSKEARFEQDKRVVLEEEQISQKGKAIARIGKKYIYEEMLDDLLEGLPAELKQVSRNPEIRSTLIKQYVMQEALFVKAKRMGLDKEPLVEKTLELTQKQLLIKHLMDKELANKLVASEEEIRALYEQQKHNYTEEASLSLRYIEVNEGEKISAVKKNLEKQQQEPIWIDSSFTYIPDLGDAERTIERLFALEPGAYSDKEKVEDKDYVFYIVEKNEGKVKPFEELKEQLKKQYLQQKEQKVTQEYINSVVEEEDVEIFGVPVERSTKQKDEMRVDKN